MELIGILLAVVAGLGAVTVVFKRAIFMARVVTELVAAVPILQDIAHTFRPNGKTLSEQIDNLHNTQEQIISRQEHIIVHELAATHGKLDDLVATIERLVTAQNSSQA